MTALTVRDVRKEDLPRLAQLEALCFSQPWTEAALAVQLDPQRHVFLAAEREGTLVGYVGLQYVLDEGYISNVAADPACRRQGVGGALLEELERRCRALGLAFMTLEVRASNLPARALYEKNGFSQVGIRKNYYEKPREDAILMTKNL